MKRVRVYIKVCMLVLTVAVSGRMSAQNSAQNFVLKNNLVYDATQTANLAAEMDVSEHWTFQLGLGYNSWSSTGMKRWRHLLVMPELRWWKKGAFVGNYIGINMAYAHFNIGGIKFPLGMWKETRHYRFQGNLVAAGVSFGHNWPLGRFVSIEAEAGVDTGHAWYEKYDCAHCGAYHGVDSKPFIAPKIAVNVVVGLNNNAHREDKNAHREQSFDSFDSIDTLRTGELRTGELRANTLRAGGGLRD